MLVLDVFLGYSVARTGFQPTGSLLDAWSRCPPLSYPFHGIPILHTAPSFSKSHPKANLVAPRKWAIGFRRSWVSIRSSRHNILFQKPIPWEGEAADQSAIAYEAVIPAAEQSSPRRPPVPCDLSFYFPCCLLGPRCIRRGIRTHYLPASSSHSSQPTPAILGKRSLLPEPSPNRE